MDKNSNKFRRCGPIGEGEEDEVSMEDFLQEQARLQADASAVLGASDPHNCTYPKGYLKRQALYACATCTPNGNAGICLACSYACHEGHDLYELYTKRFFRCDCGNAKFSGKECKLVKDREMNSRNRYNQNFKGLYCSCTRPYPDPEDTAEDEMIQCILCEDWHHGRHLKTSVPEDFFEMICPECMTKYPFLWAYHTSSDVVQVEQKANTSDHVDIDDSKDCRIEEDQKCLEDNEKKSPAKEEKSIKITSPSISHMKSDTTNQDTDSCEGTSEGVTRNGVKRERDTADEQEPVKPKVLKTELSDDVSDSKGNDDLVEDGCLLKGLQNRKYEILEHATFWPASWRSKLCQCSDCVDMYKDKDIDYLIDDSDTVQAYEEAGSNNGPTEEEEEENIFAGMHRVQQIEIAQGVRDLKTELNEFLQGFARDGKVVTETDVREFFQALEEKRRRNMNLPQDSCR